MIKCYNIESGDTMAQKKTSKPKKQKNYDRFIEQAGLMSNVRRAPNLKNAKKGK